MSWYDDILGRAAAKSVLVTPDQALPGRPDPMPVPAAHHVNGHTLTPAFPDGLQSVVVGMGCFWGAEKEFWQLDGVYTTAVGYAGGYTPNPTYEEVCSGRTGHTEVVLVVFDPEVIPYAGVLQQFWENHDPTQGMRQGNDRGTQYRSAIYTADDAQAAVARATAEAFGVRLAAAGYGEITTEIAPAGDLLLRRGLPPAVPVEEPRRLLPGARDRGQLSGRTRRLNTFRRASLRKHGVPNATEGYLSFPLNLFAYGSTLEGDLCNERPGGGLRMWRDASGYAALTRRSLRLRHDPLRRSGDRLEAVLAVALVVLAAVMLPLAIWLGNLTGDRQGALAAQQASEYRQVTATTVGDATSQSIAGDTIPTSVDTAPARWVVAGVEHRADVNVEPETLAGTEVSIWVDGDGNVASEPISASAAATAGVMVGLFTWMSTMILATTAFLGSRALLNRRRSRQWSREISEFLGSATSH